MSLLLLVIARSVAGANESMTVVLPSCSTDRLSLAIGVTGSITINFSNLGVFTCSLKTKGDKCSEDVGYSPHSTQVVTHVHLSERVPRTPPTHQPTPSSGFQTRGKCPVSAHHSRCGQTTVNKRVPIHYIISINELVHIKNPPPPTKKTHKNIHQKAVQPDIL